MPKISVIVPNYNHARFLQQRLDSILGQTFQDFELILLDDCSTDESQSILREYAADARVRMEFNDKNSGSTFKQWNRGVRFARGEYVWIAESDDHADERLLERLVTVLDTYPSTQFVYCRSKRVSVDNKLDGFADYYLNGLDPVRWTVDYRANGIEECRNYFVFRNIVPNASAVLFRRAAYDAVGGADDSLRICGDWKLWASMALIGDVAYLSEPLNYFRFHDSSVRGKDIRYSITAEESLRVVRWLLEQVPVSIATLGRVRQTLAELWIPAVITMRVPIRRRWVILRSAMAIDPRAIRTIIPAAASSLRLKIQRHRALGRPST